jgi:hypothetical protein
MVGNPNLTAKFVENGPIWMRLVVAVAPECGARDMEIWRGVEHEGLATAVSHPELGV